MEARANYLIIKMQVVMAKPGIPTNQQSRSVVLMRDRLTVSA